MYLQTAEKQSSRYIQLPPAFRKQLEMKEKSKSKKEEGKKGKILCREVSVADGKRQVNEIIPV